MTSDTLLDTEAAWLGGHTPWGVQRTSPSVTVPAVACGCVADGSNADVARCCRHLAHWRTVVRDGRAQRGVLPSPEISGRRVTL